MLSKQKETAMNREDLGPKTNDSFLSEGENISVCVCSVCVRCSVSCSQLAVCVEVFASSVYMFVSGSNGSEQRERGGRDFERE